MAGVLASPGPRYYSIAAGRPFLRDLAEGLAVSIRESGFDLPDATIYLPTRRAARALAEAFLETAPGAATLTPHIKALGDIDEDEFALDEPEPGGALEDELALDAAAPSAERRLVLARWIAEKDKTWFDGQRRWAGAISAADELGRLLDSLYTEEIPAARLEKIVPEELAAHWAHSLEFLKIVTESWPAHLEAQKLMDPAARRIALIDLQTKRWAASPPKKPVIIAGTTGSTPAVARMMKLVAGFPYGCVVLPGLDLAAPPHVWEAVDEPHPQSGLKALLKSLDIGRETVKPWPVGEGVENRRGALITVALRPADASDDWRQWAEAARSARDETAAALDGLAFIEARDEEREAAAIALKFREAVETPGRTAMLVTPDRDLARRVSMKMRRWGVVVDDSAGAPFANTPCGIYLRLVARWLCDPSDPVRLVAMMDHALFQGGLDGAACAKAVRRMDKGLRGLRPQAGLEGVRRKLEKAQALTGDVENLLAALENACAVWPGADAPFAERFEAHLAAAEMLAAGDGESGADRLWRGEDGETGADLLNKLRPGLALIVHDEAGEYADIFARLIAGGAVRRRAPAHPRLSILGPLEARLQSADLVIMGGLNEGVWPRDAAIDPFLSRPMRDKLGLPSPERRIGLAAHDFAQLAAAPEVVLTRSARAAGKPTKPSRWIVRLKNILKGAEVLELVEQSDAMAAIAAMLDAPRAVKAAAAPQPKPPVEARPDALSVTQIGTLLRDPYAIYASKILRLKKLDPLGEGFDQRYLGILFHKVLEDYVAEPLAASDEERIARLAALYETHAAEHGLGPAHEGFWRARAEEAFRYLSEWDAGRRKSGAPAVIEGEGQTSFAIDGRDFTLTARADRIDRLESGAAFIIDYKTGAPPSLEQIKTFSPQLPLTGLIVEAGGFSEFGETPVAGFEYVRVISRGASEKFAGAEGDDARKHIDDAKKGLLKILSHFADASQAYPSQPRPQFMNDYGDYDHLARRAERNAQGEGSGGDE
ncbi:double-strand break repair protein AddB [Hyphococcus sp.]|uniref:double-strand break repair protein AddB n=1 Tax=Hyphococcus sp. TaxID=2038636 RepID=UPI003D12126E